MNKQDRMFTKRMVRRYPSLGKKLQAIRSQSLTANYSGMHGGSDVSRTTESVALKDLPKDERRMYDAVKDALYVTGRSYHGKQKLSLIRQYYWRKNIGFNLICEDINISIQTGYYWNNEFLNTVYNYYIRPKD